MIYKEIIGKELYVWMNGKLLYKRWLDEGYGIIFDDIWKWTWRPKDRDKQKSND